MKIKYVIDLAGQYKEKNIDWGDYPTIGLDSINRIRKGKRLGEYYQKWEEYYDNIPLIVCLSLFYLCCLIR